MCYLASSMLTHQALGFSIRTPLLPLLLFFPSSLFSSLFSFTFLFYKAINEHYHVYPLTSKAYNSILIIMDWYTKMACYVMVQSDIDTPRLAAVFVQKFVLAGLGVPDSIVSDRGSVFMSTFWSAVCYHLKVCRRLSTAFHPQTDGQMEQQNLMLEQYLWAYITY